MPTATQYINQIQLIDRIIGGKVEGLTHADSMKQLPFPGNGASCLLDHEQTIAHLTNRGDDEAKSRRREQYCPDSAECENTEYEQNKQPFLDQRSAPTVK